MMIAVRPTRVSQSNNPSFSRGFTLIELLVSIGIIAILISVLLVVASRATRSAQRARVAGDLQTISAALEAYRQDFGDYPRLPANVTPTGSATTPPSITGAQLLCWALIAPAPQNLDGAGDTAMPPNITLPGPGFRIRSGGQGRVYGPYLPPERFKIASQKNLAIGNITAAYDNTDVILDSRDNPILYFVAAPKKPSINVSSNVVNTTGTVPNVPGYVGRGSMGTPPAIPTYVGCGSAMLYDADQNLYFNATYPGVPCNKANTGVAINAFSRVGESGDVPLDRMRVMLGDTVLINGIIGANEQAATTAPFLLWCAGSSGFFGPDTPADSNSRQECDDVTNFNP